MKALPFLLAALFLVAIVSGCVTQPGAVVGPSETPDTSLGGELQNLDTLSQDLDASELSNLESDLDNLNW